MNSRSLSPTLSLALALAGCASSHGSLDAGASEPVADAVGCVSFGDTTRLKVTVPAANPTSCLGLAVSLVEGDRTESVAGDVEVTPGYALESVSRLDLPCSRVRAGEIATAGAAVLRAEGTVVVSQVAGASWSLDAVLAFEVDDGSRESTSVSVRELTTCLAP